MNKRIIITILSIFVVLLLGLSIFFFYGMSPKDKNDNTVLFTLNSGTSKLAIADALEEQGIIRSALVLKAYLLFHNKMNLQAGVYELKSNMSPKDILNKMASGEVKNDSITITLIEGRRLSEYQSIIANKLNIPLTEIEQKMKDQEYLNTLISKYWFLESTILNPEIYNPLEGYFFTDTYEFKEQNTIEEVIEKILNHTEQKLNTVKNSIVNSEYSVHDILSMSAIIELEAVTENDRNTVSQVIRKRLTKQMGLGMDVTTYYAVKKAMGDSLTLTDLKTVSPYNTSEMNASMAGKLPIGPICNPSIMSIQSALNPTETDYLYFFADIKTGKVYFSKTFEEHVQVQKEIG